MIACVTRSWWGASTLRWWLSASHCAWVNAPDGREDEPAWIVPAERREAASMRRRRRQKLERAVLVPLWKHVRKVENRMF